MMSITIPLKRKDLLRNLNLTQNDETITPEDKVMVFPPCLKRERLYSYFTYVGLVCVGIGLYGSPLHSKILESCHMLTKITLPKKGRFFY